MKQVFGIPVVGALLLTACVTINVYFPAAEAKEAAREFVEKVIRIDRILSFTETYIFIECPHETVQTWEYEGSLEDMKTRLRSAGIFFKQFPVCSAAHAAAQLMQTLIGTHALKAADVVEVTCDVTPTVAISLVHNRPTSPQEAQFSMPFALGAILAYGDLGIASLNAQFLADLVLRQATPQTTMARDAHVGQLLLGHFSSRYKDTGRLLTEAVEIFPNTLPAQEGRTYEVGLPGVQG